MASTSKLTDAAALELYRVALENAANQSDIATALADLGYGSAKIDEGKALLATTRGAYYRNKTEDDETLVAYADFATKREELEGIYSLHRKKAKVVFRKDAITAEKLAVTGTLPKAYVRWIETVKKFYTTAAADPAIQAKLATLSITAEDITAVNTKVTVLDAARAEYLKENGESQDATKTKDAAFAAMDDWMSEFYAVARIALEDKPQLLEALGKVIRS